MYINFILCMFGEGIQMEERRWYKNYPSSIPHHLKYPQKKLPDFLREAAEDFPQKDALLFLGKKVKYGELYEQACQFAHVMMRFGIKKGDRVAVMLPNCPQTVIAYYGALMVGAIVVQTNPIYVERELQHQLIDSGAKLIVCLDLVFPKVKRVMGSTSLKHAIVTSIKDYLPFPKNLLYPLKVKKDGMAVDVTYDSTVFPWTGVMKEAPNNPIDVEIDIVNDLALLQYTGGTTGLAKGAMLTHANLIANTTQAKSWLYKSRRGQEKFLAALPFFHVYGMTIIMNFAIFDANTMVLLPKFDATAVLQAINKEKPTLFPGAPTMYVALINHPDIKKYEVSSIEACLSGAAPLPLEVQEKFEKLTGGRLVEGYGLTECSPVTHANPIWDRRKNGSIGLPWPDTDCRIVDPNTGEDVPDGDIGELVMQGPQIMKGYWNKPEETMKVLKDGWFHTGDMATMDDEGYFYIVDRKKDMIIASGFNIYPREVEEVLFQHEAVKEAAVVGIPDAYRGETVKAYIVLKEGKQVTVEEIEQFCRQQLTAYKVPKQIEFRKDLPKTLVGKVLRRVLLEEEENNVKV